MLTNRGSSDGQASGPPTQGAALPGRGTAGSSPPERREPFRKSGSAAAARPTAPAKKRRRSRAGLCLSDYLTNSALNTEVRGNGKQGDSGCAHQTG